MMITLYYNKNHLQSHRNKCEAEKSIKSLRKCAIPLKQKICVFLLLLTIAILSSQSPAPWYANLLAKATLSPDGAIIQIGDKDYHIYNAFDPIAPKGGERVIDYAGVLDYYMWIHKTSDGDFTVSRIDNEFNIFYYDQETQKYTSPAGKVIP
jgi:hypothetical protein